MVSRDLGRLLILAGVGLAVAGLLVMLGAGKLPGDLIYRRGSFTLYFPLMSSILLSLLLTLLLWLFRR